MDFPDTFGPLKVQQLLETFPLAKFGLLGAIGKLKESRFTSKWNQPIWSCQEKVMTGGREPVGPHSQALGLRPRPSPPHTGSPCVRPVCPEAVLPKRRVLSGETLNLIFDAQRLYKYHMLASLQRCATCAW